MNVLKMFFKNEGGMKTFPDQQKLREFFASRRSLQDKLKEVHQKRKNRHEIVTQIHRKDEEHRKYKIYRYA